MNYRKIFLYNLLFILFGSITVLSQQSINFERLSIAEGLSSESVNSITQDELGYLWFSTEEGLNRYDGYNLVVYRNEPLDSNSLKGNRVFSTYNDNKGNLWVCTDEALNLYNYNTDEFEIFQMNPQSTRQFFNAAVSIIEDHRGDLWVAKAYHGLTKFNRQDKEFIPARLDSTSNTFINFVVISIKEDRYKNLWYTGGDNNSVLYKVNKDRTEEKNYSIDDSKSVPKPELLSMTLNLDNDNNLWITTKNGYAYKYDKKTDDFKEQFYIPGARISSLMFDEDCIWVATSNMGIIKYDIATAKSIKYIADANNKNSLQSNITMQVLKDNSGVFWVATRNAGLNKFDPNKEPISLYTLPNEIKEDRNFVLSLAQNKTENKVWVGTGSGIFSIDIESNKLLQSNFKYDGLNSTDKKNIRSIYEDSKNNLWFGVWGEGLFKLNQKTKKIIKFNYKDDDINSLPNNNVRTIYEDNENKIWIGTQSGLARYDQDNNEFYRFKSFDTTYTTPITSLVDSLLKHNGIATINRVKINQNITKPFRIDKKGKYLVVDIGEVFELNSAMLWDYGWIEDNLGNIIWIQDSLNTRHAGGNIKNRITVDLVDLKPGDYKLRFKSDDSHSFGSWNTNAPLWETSWGISLYDIDEQQINLIEKELPKKEFQGSISSENIRAIFQDSKGKYWFGSEDNGFTIYNPTENIYTQFTPNSKNIIRNVNAKINSFYEDHQGNIWVATFGGLLQINSETFEMRTFSIRDGLPTAHIIDILQDEYNNLWLSTLKGLVKFEPGYKNQMPTFISYDLKDGLQGFEFNAGAKCKTNDGQLFFGGNSGINGLYPGQVNHIAPEILFTDLKIMNESIHSEMDNSPLDQNIAVTKKLILNHDQNVFTLEFVALHFSKPEKNQYAYILEGFDKAWNVNNRRFATYTNLNPGDYIFKVIAANSDGIWNDHGKSLFITIRSPWWQTIWAYLLYGFVIIISFVTFNKTQKNKIKKKERQKAILEQAELRAQAAELQAQAAEAQARVMQAENERKTKELEEARSLQLAMLPKELPNLENLDIAVYMRTATEVGGDYYDFYLDADETLTVVIGDATGHGLNAGTMVTATKSLFTTLASNSDILLTFKEMSRVIKNMKFRMLTMCLSILKIKNGKIKISSAGMPPAHIFRKDRGEVEEFLIRGMPLGIKNDFPYKLVETEIKSGDIILLMSDGFPELFNPDQKMIGYDEVKNIFMEATSKSAIEIIDHFNQVATDWAKGVDPHDDITFVVIKVK